jgi:hypothetical protein
MQLASGLAPNLKRVHIAHRGFGTSASDVATVRRGRPPWQGFFPEEPSEGGSTDAPRLIHLEGWSLCPSIMQYFQSLGNRLDFATL